MSMFTYDFTHFFSFRSWLRKELSYYDKDLGCNAKEDLIEALTSKFDNELITGYLHEIKC